MGAIAIAVAAALAAALIVRELVWRREHVRLRERLADGTAVAREQEHDAQVAQIVAGLAQELKSPLQAVLGNTELLLASGTHAAAPAASIAEIQENAARAAGIVRNLLAFTDTHALTRRWHDINNLVSGRSRCVASMAPAR